VAVALAVMFFLVAVVALSPQSGGTTATIAATSATKPELSATNCHKPLFPDIPNCSSSSEVFLFAAVQFERRIELQSCK
jgi:hypothetical protein